MAKARDLKRRIGSLQKTKQITKTMELVATSRMKKTQQRVFAARPYAERLRSILSAIDLDEYVADFPLLATRAEVRRVAVLLVTSNRGLCGAFNANVIRLGRRMLGELKDAGVETELHIIGKKGATSLRYRGYAIASSRIDIGDRPTFEQAREVAGLFLEKFLRGEIDEFRIVCASFRSLSSQPPVAETILPLSRGGEAGEPGAEFLLEPSARAVLEELLPRIAEHRVFQALLENAAGEQAARRVAMKNATDNAEELIRILTRSYNRARQGQITQELAEIVGGAEALV